MVVYVRMVGQVREYGRMLICCIAALRPVGGL